MRASQPNILLVMSDQHNARFMGNAGHAVVRTPALDQLAAQGTRCSAAYCPHPLCVPSRIGFLTGRLPSEVGGWGNGSVLDSDTPTFAHAFAAAGWESILCGRMHFEGPDQFHGFQRRIFGDSTYSLSPEILGQGRNRTNGQTRYAVEVAGFGQSGFQTFDQIVTDRACRFLRERPPADPPFCLVVGLMLPHNPLICSRRWFDYYMHALPPLDLPTPRDIERFHPAIRAWRHRRGVDDLTPLQHRRALAAYCGLVTELDQNLGVLLRALRQSAFAENTLVVYCSDHGDQAAEHGMWWKSAFYEGSARVPLIFHQPGRIPAGRELPSVVSLIDIAPTLLELVGTPPMPIASGRSFSHLLLDQPGLSWPDEAFSEYAGDHGDQPSCMLRRGRWKLIYYSEFDSCLLFDMHGDPREQQDLANDPAHRPIVDALLADTRQRWSAQRMIDGLKRDRERWKSIKDLPPIGPHPVEHHQPLPADNAFDFSQLPQPPVLR